MLSILVHQVGCLRIPYCEPDSRSAPNAWKCGPTQPLPRASNVPPLRMDEARQSQAPTPGPIDCTGNSQLLSAPECRPYFVPMNRRQSMAMRLHHSLSRRFRRGWPPELDQPMSHPWLFCIETNKGELTCADLLVGRWTGACCPHDQIVDDHPPSFSPC